MPTFVYSRKEFGKVFKYLMRMFNISESSERMRQAEMEQNKEIDKQFGLPLRKLFRFLFEKLYGQ